MSSEALKRIQAEAALAANRELTVATLERLGVVEAELATARQDLAEDYRWKGLYDEIADALAVAREREQRAVKALPFVDDALEALRDGAGKAVRPDTARNLLAKAHAALVDEPAAATDEVAAILATVPDPRDDALLRIWTAARMNTAESLRNFVLDVVPRVIPAVATLAEPEAGADKGATASAVSGSVRTPSGSASAAADEPGETPA